MQTVEREDNTVAELVKLILTQIPKYLANFLNLFAAPKAFVRDRNKNTEDNLANALTFLGISFLITMILCAPLFPAAKSESVQFLMLRGLQTFIFVVFGAVGVWLSWRCVGGRPQFGRLFITYCYQAGLMTVLTMILVTLCPLGLARAFDPELYSKLVDLVVHPTLHSTALIDFSKEDPFSRRVLVFLAYRFMSGFSNLGIVCWLFISWGAYRELTGLSKGRSFGAAVIFVVLSFPIVAVSLLLLKAVS